MAKWFTRQAVSRRSRRQPQPAVFHGIAKDQSQRQRWHDNAPVAARGKGRAGADKGSGNKREQQLTRLNTHQEGDYSGHHIAEDFQLRRQRATVNNHQRPYHAAHDRAGGNQQPFQAALWASEIGRTAEETGPAQQAK